MFTNTNNYNISLYNSDQSLHDGVPKKYYDIRNKKFNDWEIPPWELFIFSNRKLGEGSFAKVYLGKWRETFVVAKVLNNVLSDKDKMLVLREIEIMTKLHHPNIVQFLGYIDDPFILIMEYIPNNDLLEHINKKSLKLREKKTIMRDILQGLGYIHNRRPYSLIHRDIKPTNILLTNSKVAKITDFGLSKLINQNTLTDSINSNVNLNNDLSCDVGTERYMAPEILNNVNNTQYTNKVDIYSCGILLYELFENKRYIHGRNFKWYYTPKIIKKIIIENMLNENPDDRNNALSILSIYNNVIKF
tara:strand:+ start:127 stop:1035 length:909 start_codon:yes stop_codon:yes gene_type:complete